MSQSVDQHLNSLRRIIADLEHRLAQDEAWQALQAFETEHRGASGRQSTDEVFARQRLEQRLSRNSDYRIRQRLLEACTILSAAAPSKGAPLSPPDAAQAEPPSVVQSAPLQTLAPTDKAAEKPTQDLCLIRGINRAMAERLNAEGVRRYEQIAAWTRDDCKRITDALNLGRTISRQNWIEQAAVLSKKSDGPTQRPTAVCPQTPPPKESEGAVTSSPCTMPDPLPVVPDPHHLPVAELQPTKRSHDLLAMAVAQICQPQTTPPAEPPIEDIITDGLDRHVPLPSGMTALTAENSDDAPPVFSAHSCQLPHRATLDSRSRSLQLPQGSSPFSTLDTIVEPSLMNAKEARFAEQSEVNAPEIPPSTSEPHLHALWSGGEQFPKDIIRRPSSETPVGTTAPEPQQSSADIDPALHDRVADNSYTPPAQAFGNVLRRRTQRQDPPPPPPPLINPSPSVPAAISRALLPQSASVADVPAEVSLPSQPAIEAPAAERPPPITSDHISHHPVIEPSPRSEPRTAGPASDAMRGGFGDGSQWRTGQPDRATSRQCNEDLLTDRLLNQQEEATVEIVRRDVSPPVVASHGPRPTGLKVDEADADPGKRPALRLSKRLFHAMTGRSS
jgi:predicted flap endonuclease-1-like 5' DNA nuclease